jgi:(1->4)-alpha-D-glucan 1-alpha-D-glucosylmutase
LLHSFKRAMRLKHLIGTGFAMACTPDIAAIQKRLPKPLKSLRESASDTQHVGQRAPPRDQGNGLMGAIVQERSTSIQENLEPRLSAKRVQQAIVNALQHPPAGRIPTSTYRVQFGEQFTFADACQAAAYLRRLGIGDLYGSPAFHATSPHGYDINDHRQMNPALGGASGFERLLDQLHWLGLGYVMDVVPNHMGIAGGDNPWWNNVLENGQASPYASYFDIDWYPLKSEMQGQVLLPILGDQYGRVLERGELRLELSQGAFSLRYGERSLPIDPGSYAQLLQPACDRLAKQLPADDPTLMELQSILTALQYLPGRDTTEPDQVAERQREKDVIKRRLASLMDSAEQIRVAVEQTLAEFNGNAEDPASFDRLDALIASQAYRLAFWRVAAEEINYRRFFDINELAAIKMERPEVFHEAHELVMSLVGRGAVTGLRVDHPDGLWDPQRYFSDLQRAAVVAWAQAALEAELGPLEADERQALAQAAQEQAAAIDAARPLYLLAEKIVEHNERLPTGWAIHGTTGYEFLNVLGGLFVDRSSEKALTETYERFIGGQPRLRDMVYHAKRLILRTSMASELNVLAHALDRIAQHNRHYRDFTLGSLTEVLREAIATFPVYRSYISEQTSELDPHDREAIEQAVRLARRRNPELDGSLFDFLHDLLLLQLPGTPEAQAEQRHFVMRFQQLSGPVMAKGLEDTAFYLYNRLIALNEVGGDPGVFGLTPADFHRYNREHRRAWPHTMLATSTHDTKRSEDVRARIAVLSEMPRRWHSAVGHWRRLNRAKKQRVEEQLFPSANDEYLLYQSLVGAWPLDALDGNVPDAFVERVVAYMAKAANEGKVHTSWLNPNPDYDQALEQFVRQVLADQRFLADFLPLQREVAQFGALNALAQVTLKFAAPGVPDLYQGNECWNFSLVDPDNRRPVDFGVLATTLTALEQQAQGKPWRDLARELAERWQDGRIKLWVTHRALCHRRAHPELYCAGNYQPVEATGAAAEHLVAFARTLGQQTVIAVAPRLLRRLTKQLTSSNNSTFQPLRGSAPWQGTTLALPAGRYRQIFTDEHLTSDGQLAVGELFANFPVALLERES